VWWNSPESATVASRFRSCRGAGVDIFFFSFSFVSFELVCAAAQTCLLLRFKRIFKNALNIRIYPFALNGINVR
jgi:hypothetical protein